jgi:hypothetical protein
MAAHCLHSAQAASKTEVAYQIPDMLRHFIHEKNADEFSNQRNEVLQFEHAGTVALIT